MQVDDRNPIALATSVGDKAFHMLTIMWINGQAVSLVRLMSLTNYSPNTLLKALNRPRELGLAARHGNCSAWQPTSLGRQCRLRRLAQVNPQELRLRLHKPSTGPRYWPPSMTPASSKPSVLGLPRCPTSRPITCTPT